MFEPMGPTGGGPLPDRGRRRNAVNALVFLAGVAGLALGGWGLYDAVTTHQARGASRALITSACAGLVDGDEVLGLRGGVDRLRLSDRAENTVDFVSLPDSCDFQTVIDGKKYGDQHFVLKVRVLPAGPPENRLDTVPRAPFPGRGDAPRADLTAQTAPTMRRPLGDGLLGDYGARDVTVTAPCATPLPGTGATAVRASALTGDSRATDTDRRALARIARTAALRLAAELGCTTRLPELPDALPAQATALGPATGDRHDACGWYAALLRTTDRGALPDRALGSPQAAAARTETCRLAVSPGETERIHTARPRADRDHVDLHAVLTRDPWWLETRSYFGEDGGSVGIGDGRLPSPVGPGTAGERGALTYATASCQGHPAVFTLLADRTYASQVIRDRYAEVFGAYVRDAAARHGCTQVTLPQ
ncbi:hypothetical protein ABT143_16520 [Streptomyces sp. NPDC002033]|uniref:hypothetical protein n=1 Tax=unclassified Streptomyces TaxID=2593676 RepID=UPI0033215F84